MGGQEEGEKRYKVESELERANGGDEDQEDEVDGDVADALSHAG